MFLLNQVQLIFWHYCSVKPIRSLIIWTWWVFSSRSSWIFFLCLWGKKVVFVLISAILLDAGVLQQHLIVSSRAVVLSRAEECLVLFGFFHFFVCLTESNWGTWTMAVSAVHCLFSVLQSSFKLQSRAPHSKPRCSATAAVNKSQANKHKIKQRWKRMRRVFFFFTRSHFLYRYNVLS